MKLHGYARHEVGIVLELRAENAVRIMRWLCSVRDFPGALGPITAQVIFAFSIKRWLAPDDSEGDVAIHEHSDKLRVAVPNRDRPIHSYLLGAMEWITQTMTPNDPVLLYGSRSEWYGAKRELELLLEALDGTPAPRPADVFRLLALIQSELDIATEYVQGLNHGVSYGPILAGHRSSTKMRRADWPTIEVPDRNVTKVSEYP